ncbi:CBS domain-containing protein [Candidatus Omnitrophota bacterium]
MQKVKEVMNRRVITIPADMELKKICNILSKNSLSGVPVVDMNNKLIGFVSERDIVSTVASGESEKKQAKHIMCRRLITVTEDTLLSKVTKIFADHPFRHIPVVKKGEVVGIISRRDIASTFFSS